MSSPRCLVALSLTLSGCDACLVRPTERAAPSTLEPRSGESRTVSRRPAVESEHAVALPGDVRVGTATVSGESEKRPTDPAPGFRHAMSFSVNVTVANPGQSLLFELVDRVSPEADAEAERRLLALEAVVGRETLEGTLSFFTSEQATAGASPARRVRLVVGAEKVEVALPARSLPSRRCRASATSMKNPILHAKEWAPLLFYAQAQDDRGLEVRMLEPPLMLLEGKTHAYPAWPEPGLLWRVKPMGL